MTNTKGVLEYLNYKHNQKFKIGKYAKVISKDYPEYNFIGKVIYMQELESQLFVTLQINNDCVSYPAEDLEIVYKIRGFEKISSIKADIPLPQRKTKKSAGYDIAVIHPKVYEMLLDGYTLEEAWSRVSQMNGKAVVTKAPNQCSIILPTGVKAYMMDDEWLDIIVRSNSGIKKGIRQANPHSAIDADYYNNPNNEGHIFFAIHNDSIVFDAPMIVIAQGIFLKYLAADTGNLDNERVGGIGSTNN